MPTRRRLTGRRIAVLAADGFEKVELVVPRLALKAAGATVDIVSLRRGRIRGVNLHMPATRVRVDTTVQDARAGDYDALLLPGGFINADLLRQSAPARAFVRAFVESGKPVASLCHGPCSPRRECSRARESRRLIRRRRPDDTSGRNRTRSVVLR